MVGGDALLGERLLRGRGGLNAQGSGVKRFGGNAQRLAVAALAEYGGGIVQTGAKRADVAARRLDIANEDVRLFIAERGIGRGRIDKGDFETHAACKGTSGIDRIAREVSVGILHGLRGIGSIEGDRQGSRRDQGIVRYRGGNGLALDLVDRGRRERGQWIERASAQAQNGNDRRGPST